jgi:phospholipid/cholesterol/gamma-HCH transport system substrate-binding protein
MPLRKTLELVVGLFVVLGIGAFFWLAIQVSDISRINEQDGYNIKARFESIGGLKVRSAVTIAGVRIGRVAAIDIDKDTYEAVVSMSLNPDYPLPTDTSASILTAGLLGEQYIGLEPGGMTDHLKNGDEIGLTQSAMILERLIGQFLFNTVESKK